MTIVIRGTFSSFVEFGTQIEKTKHREFIIPMHNSSVRILVIQWDLKKFCEDSLIFVYDLFLLFCFYRAGSQLSDVFDSFLRGKSAYPEAINMKPGA